jgi:hypothetical protein
VARSIAFELVILDSAGRKVRTLQDGWLLAVVTDFNLSTTLFEPDGRMQLRIWADTMFEAFWDGTNENKKLVASGQYYIQSICTDSLDHRTVVTKALSVMRPAVKIVDGVRLSPNPARDHVNIWVQTSIEGATVRVKVYSVAGELISKLDFDNADVMSWNLTNQGGEPLASGVYLVVIMAGDPQTGMTERQVLKLAVIR